MDNQFVIEISFGLTRQDNSAITEREFDKFQYLWIEPSFSEGFSIVSAQGHWLGGSEGSKLLKRVTSAKKLELDWELALEIAQAYKSEFDQESVLVHRYEVQAIFV